MRHCLQSNAEDDAANRSVILSDAANRSLNLLLIIIKVKAGLGKQYEGVGETIGRG